MKSGRFSASRGQTSFEFILVIAITLLVVGATAFDVASESGKTFVLSAVKHTASAYATSAIGGSCQNVALRSVSLDEASATVKVSFAGPQSCWPKLQDIADYVENSCGAKPNGDAFVDCNPKVSLTSG